MRSRVFAVEYGGPAVRREIAAAARERFAGIAPRVADDFADTITFVVTRRRDVAINDVPCDADAVTAPAASVQSSSSSVSSNRSARGWISLSAYVLKCSVCVCAVCAARST